MPKTMYLQSESRLSGISRSLPMRLLMIRAADMHVIGNHAVRNSRPRTASLSALNISLPSLSINANDAS